MLCDYVMLVLVLISSTLISSPPLVLPRPVSFPTVYAQQAGEIRDQVVGDLRCKIELRLEDASVHRKAEQRTPRTGAGHAGSA